MAAAAVTGPAPGPLPQPFPGLESPADTPSPAQVAAQTYRVMVPLLKQGSTIRISADGGKTFRRFKDEHVFTGQVPLRPSTINVFDPGATGRFLWLDLDVGKVTRPDYRPDPVKVAKAAADEREILELVQACGGRAITDVSPNGGRHIAIPFANPFGWLELRDLCHAFAARWTSIDTSPMNSPHGQIRPPGAAHKLQGGRLSGYMTLTMPLEQAAAIARNPNGSSVWEALRDSLAAELQALTPAVSHQEPTAFDEAGAPWYPQGGAPDGSGRPLPAEQEAIAVTGTWDPARLIATGSGKGKQWSSSEACQSVLAHAACRGWQLAQISAGMRDGSWPGLARMYAVRYRSDQGRERALAGDWRKAITTMSGDREKTAPHSDIKRITTRAPAETSASETETDDPGRQEGRSPQQAQAEGTGRGGGDLEEDEGARTHLDDHVACDQDQHLGAGNVPLQCKDADLDRTVLQGVVLPSRQQLELNPYQQILRWQNAVWAAERDSTRVTAWGGRATSMRRVLRALARATQMIGQVRVAVGVRSLALLSGLHIDTVATVLRELREEDDPLIAHVAPHWDLDADAYALRVPDAYADIAAWRRWPAGQAAGIHYALWEQSEACGLVLEVLTTIPTRTRDIAVAAAVADRSTNRALADLAVLGIAAKQAGGWALTGLTLDEVAATNGGRRVYEERLAAYEADRVRWKGMVGSWHAWLEPPRPDGSWGPSTGPGPRLWPDTEPIDSMAERGLPPHLQEDPWEDEYERHSQAQTVTADGTPPPMTPPAKPPPPVHPPDHNLPHVGDMAAALDILQEILGPLRTLAEPTGAAGPAPP